MLAFCIELLDTDCLLPEIYHPDKGVIVRVRILKIDYLVNIAVFIEKKMFVQVSEVDGINTTIEHCFS